MICYEDPRKQGRQHLLLSCEEVMPAVQLCRPSNFDPALVICTVPMLLVLTVQTKMKDCSRSQTVT